MTAGCSQPCYQFSHSPSCALWRQGARLDVPLRSRPFSWKVLCCSHLLSFFPPDCFFSLLKERFHTIFVSVGLQEKMLLPKILFVSLLNMVQSAVSTYNLFNSCCPSFLITTLCFLLLNIISTVWVFLHLVLAQQSPHSSPSCAVLTAPGCPAVQGELCSWLQGWPSTGALLTFQQPVQHCRADCIFVLPTAESFKEFAELLQEVELERSMMVR